MMNPQEINERAWEQMQVLTDEEVRSHVLLAGETDTDIWDLRIKLRDKFYNELYEEINGR